LINHGRLIVLAGALSRPRWSVRLVTAGLAAVIALSAVAIELAQLQVTDGVALAALGRENSVHRTVLEADRGIIYDRHGTALVQNSPAWNLEVIPAALPLTAGARSAEIEELARLTGMSPVALAIAIAKADPYGSAKIGPDLTEPQELALAERLPGLPGVSIARHAVRTYLYPTILGHVIGYVGPIDATELPQLRRLGYQRDVFRLAIVAG